MHSFMVLVLLLPTLCLHVVSCPRWLTRAWVVNYRGAATRPRSLAPYWTHPVPLTVVTAAAPAPATPPPLRRPQGPDPLPGQRVSKRPQPTWAPRDEAMALGPLQGRVPARAVARGPTREWAGGGMARGTAAVALRLPLPPGVTGTPPPPGCHSVQGADRKGELPNRGARGAGSATAEGGGKPAPKPAGPSAQPDRGANRGTSRRRFPPARGAKGGYAQAEGHARPCQHPNQQRR